MKKNPYLLGQDMNQLSFAPPSIDDMIDRRRRCGPQPAKIPANQVIDLNRRQHAGLADDLGQFAGSGGESIFFP